MIVFLLVVGSLGALAAPGTPETSHLAKNTMEIWSSLPNTENLDEKAMPLSKLVADEQLLLPGRQNLLEKSQVPVDLPGIRNLEEKRIPDLVLQKLAETSSGIDREESDI